ncbi:MULTISPECIES: RNA polymerase recycling motor HelD [Niallia]|uniref:AAA family ATPase n=1 Tax=Niallia alba TaxID=2729105 RepID=A0A7Y0KBT8_9BACI|nr:MULTISPECIES: RNA polymerase recycling motor HelD [Niallia]MBQ6449196.1 AAA family ATPase [Bacillus sp. (in: firmicutes)]NMO78810.1 AAA family ATPase [Niallia alba]UTI42082.1 AAA family ATPase [Niallia sp. RD1]
MEKGETMEDFSKDEWEQEERRLEYTKNYMNVVLQEAQINQGTLQENVRESISNEEALDSSLSYINYLTNSKFLQLATTELNILKRILDAPYFARIDYQMKGKSHKDVYYLGKTSLYEKDTQKPIIVDWRSPIANVYYDGRLGEVAYEVNEETIEGYLSLKRQFKIEKGKLNHYQDIDLTTTDELLQQSLAGKADQRLSEIISTIQAEQNEIIRADLNRPIIVQGAAGSGKTTIALHRISYFIYNYARYFQPEQLMIIAPNNMFIGYIAEALPDLGVEKIRQTTFLDYVLLCIGKKMKVIQSNKKLLTFINHENKQEELVKWLSRYKGSLAYKKVMDKYLMDICNEMSPKEDFRVEKFPLYGAKKLERLFKKEYDYLPLIKRKEKIKGILQADLKRKKKIILIKLEEKYEEALDRALRIKEDDKRKEKVVYFLDTKEERLANVKKEASTAVRKYMKTMQTTDLYGYYARLFEDKKLLRKYTEDSLTEKQLNYMIAFQRKILKQKKVEMEDLGALFYLQYKIFGIDKEYRAKNIVIDEVQDYSEFQLYALKAGLETDMFTLVGDLAQGIHSYRGLQNWQTLQQIIFPRANYMTLQKSYRTTIEIMFLANEILHLLDEDLPKVKPVVRHGEKPTVHLYDQKQALVDKMIELADGLHGEGFHSIAIIGKTEEECKAIFKEMQKRKVPNVQFLQENEELEKNYLIIVPSYLSKGLEFDAVFLFTLNEVFTQEEIDLKLLYVAMTRPMHRLHLFTREKTALLLDKANESHFTVEIAK